MVPDSSTPLSRVVRVERQLRRVQLLAWGGALLAATLLLAGFDDKPGEVVQAERLELVTAKGVRQAILSADTLGFALTLLDEKGSPTGILRLGEEPRLSVQTGRGREVAGLGFPQVHQLTE
jgi:hypothetical protein